MRRILHVLVALAAVGLLAAQRAPRIKKGDTVVVTAKSASVTVRRKTVKRLEEGDTFRVEKMNRNAVAHYLDVGGKRQLGWVNRSAVERSTGKERDKGEDKSAGADTKNQGTELKPGAVLKTTVENAPLRLPPRGLVGLLPKGTKFTVMRVTPREVFGFAEIGIRRQQGWLVKAALLPEKTETAGTDDKNKKDKKKINRPIKKGDTVVVTTADARFTKNRKLLAQLDKGTTFKVARVSEDGVAGYVVVEKKRLAGWVDKGDVSLKSTGGDKDDDNPLGGVWKVVFSEYEGEENEAEIGVRYRFRDGTLQITDQQNRTTRSKYEFDSSDELMTIDVTAASSAGASASAGKRQMGIVKLEDDTLTICLASTRPTEFTSEPGDETYLRVLERVKSRAR